MTDKLLTERPRFIPEITAPDLSRVFVIDYGDRTVTIHVMDLVHTAEEQAFHVDSFEYLVVLARDWERLLTEAGYQDVTCYDGYSFDPYDPETSEGLVVAASTEYR